MKNYDVVVIGAGGMDTSGVTLLAELVDCRPRETSRDMKVL